MNFLSNQQAQKWLYFADFAVLAAAGIHIALLEDIRRIFYDIPSMNERGVSGIKILKKGKISKKRRKIENLKKILDKRAGFVYIK